MAFANWLSRAVRSTGSYTTPSYTIPSGINTVAVQLNLVANSDFSTSEKTLTITLQVSADGGTNWNTRMVIEWVGGAPSRSGTWSARITGINSFAGQLVRAIVVQTGSFRWGLRGEIIK